MDEKLTFMKRIYRSKWKQILFFLISMGTLLGIFGPLSQYFHKAGIEKPIKEAQIKEDYMFFASIEELSEIDNKETELRGRMLRIDSVIMDCSIVLKNISNEKEIVLETVIEQEEDKEERNSVFCNENSELKFVAKVKNNVLKKDTCYEVIIYFSYEFDEVRENESTYRETNY